MGAKQDALLVGPTAITVGVFAVVCMQTIYVNICGCLYVNYMCYSNYIHVQCVIYTYFHMLFKCIINDVGLSEHGGYPQTAMKTWETDGNSLLNHGTWGYP